MLRFVIKIHREYITFHEHSYSRSGIGLKYSSYSAENRNCLFLCVFFLNFNTLTVRFVFDFIIDKKKSHGLKGATSAVDKSEFVVKIK